ncbi:hypothetical protein EVAR_102010_1 [Eumeta japonica]|uniref:Uncharacterized protein n=1 Tax=Eumeta variegata TaxID=151549 RepID=A0A4C2AEN0_EUMVA|nr:hypothetical protein EVAR_102010_1 [Eumeta japonica]
MKDEEIHCMSVLTELWTLTRASRQRERAERRPPGQRVNDKINLIILTINIGIRNKSADPGMNPEEFRKSVSGVQRATDPSVVPDCGRSLVTIVDAL